MRGRYRERTGKWVMESKKSDKREGANRKTCRRNGERERERQLDENGKGQRILDERKYRYALRPLRPTLAPAS